MNYSVYTVEDFVADEFFIQWVKNPTEEGNAYWSAWLSKHPDREPDIREARRIVLMLNFSERQAPEGKFLEIWEKISDSADQKVLEISQGGPKIRTVRHFSGWYKIAATFLVATAAAIYAVLSPDTIVVRTAFGESRVLFLPDSSKVTLNANSVLRYDPDFSEEGRAVWLDGEAFFAIVNKEDNQNFHVYTEELEVEVLGTRFNVNSRRGRSKVMLEEGKVKLDIPRGDKKLEVIMKPGELVEVSKKAQHIEKKEVDVNNYSSWRSNKLVFVGAPLSEIAELLEDNYGVTVKFQDEGLKDEQFTGSASVDDPDELIDKLNKVFGLNIQRQGNDLIFQYK